MARGYLLPINVQTRVKQVLFDVIKASGFLAFASLSLVSCTQDVGRSLEAKPNIVLITLDCFRADRLAAYGGDPTWTPNLNALAEKGTVFLNAHTAVGTTYPSLATILTGLYPRYHGVRSNYHTLPNKLVTVGEILSEHGYATGSFVSLRHLQLGGNMDQGFAGLSDPRRTGPHDHVRWDEDTIRLAIDWLHEIESRDERPFFLWVHLYHAHGPYRLTEWSRQRLGDYQGMLKDGATPTMLRQRKQEILASESDLRALQTLYTGEVHKVDRQVGKLLEAMNGLTEANRSVVIAVADHGQGIGLNGHTGHGPVLREDVLRVPLIVTDFRNPKFQRIEEIVGTIDLTPTILDLTGIDTAIDFQGRSLIPAIKRGELGPDTYFAGVRRRSEPHSNGEWYTPNRVAVYDSGFKLIHRPNEPPSLFDLTKDSLADSPLDPEQYPTRMDYMIGLAEDFLAYEIDSQRAKLSEDDLEMLRSLGYIQ